jgi:hypothetical protein
MTTVLTLSYDAYAEIKVPKAHAEKLRDGEWKYWVKWGTIHYTDDKGEEHEIEGTQPEVDCKWPQTETWQEEEDGAAMLEENRLRYAAIQNLKQAEKKLAYISNAVGHQESSEDGSIQGDKPGDEEGVFEGDNKGEGGSSAAAPASD